MERQTPNGAPSPELSRSPGRRQRSPEIAFADELWTHLQLHSKRLNSVNMQASEVTLSLAQQLRTMREAKAAKTPAVAKVTRSQSQSPPPKKPVAKLAERPREGFELPSYIRDLQLEAEEEERDWKEFETTGVADPSMDAYIGLRDIGAGLGAAAAAVTVQESEKSAKIDVTEEGKVPGSPYGRCHVYGTRPWHGYQAPPREPVMEMIPQHFASDLLWEHRHFMMSAQQVRWDETGEGKSPKALRNELTPMVCHDIEKKCHIAALTSPVATLSAGTRDPRRVSVDITPRAAPALPELRCMAQTPALSELNLNMSPRPRAESSATQASELDYSPMRTMMAGGALSPLSDCTPTHVRSLTGGSVDRIVAAAPHVPRGVLPCSVAISPRWGRGSKGRRQLLTPTPTMGRGTGRTPPPALSDVAQETKPLREAVEAPEPAKGWTMRPQSPEYIEAVLTRRFGAGSPSFSRSSTPGPGSLPTRAVPQVTRVGSK